MLCKHHKVQTLVAKWNAGPDHDTDCFGWSFLLPFSIDACTVDQTGGNGERLQEIHDLGLGSLFHPPFPRIYKKEERVFFLQFLHCHRCIYLAKEN